MGLSTILRARTATRASASTCPVGRAIQASIEEAEIELRKAQALHAELLRAIRSEVLEKIEQLRLLAQVFELNRAAGGELLFPPGAGVQEIR
jgi:hypothetical protein